MMLLERVGFQAVPALTLVDEFARVRGTCGPLPTPLGAVQFLILAQITGAGPVPFEPALVLATSTNPSGVYLFRGEVTGRIATGSPVSLPDGRYRLRIESDFYRPIDLESNWPLQGALTLLPNHAYPFPDVTTQTHGFGMTLIRGALFETGGKPWAGVTVTLVDPPVAWPFSSYVTGTSGDWVLVLPDRRKFSAVEVPAATVVPATLTVRFDFPNGNVVELNDVGVNLATENSLPQTALRGRVTSASGLPQPGCRVTVSLTAGESHTAGDGGWSLYLDLLQPDAQTEVTVETPDGRRISQTVNVRRRATVVVPTFRVATN